MAKNSAVSDETLAVLAALDKAFGGEIEYDEALEQLQLYTSQVRKQFPALYQALLNTAKLRDQSSSEWQAAVSHALETLPTSMMVAAQAVIDNVTGQVAGLKAELGRVQVQAVPAGPRLAPAPMPPDPDGTVLVSEENSSGIAAVEYDTFVQTQLVNVTVNKDYPIRWTNANVPLPTVGSSLTLKRQDGYRIRFSIVDWLGADIAIFRSTAILPAGA